MMLQQMAHLGIEFIARQLMPLDVNPACTDAFIQKIHDGIATVVSLLTALGVAIAVVSIIVGGLMRMTAFGNERKIYASNTAITCAVIGLLIVLLSVAFGNAIPNWFHIQGCTL